MSETEKSHVEPSHEGDAKSQAPRMESGFRYQPISGAQGSSDRLEFVKRAVSFGHLGANLLPGTGPVGRRIFQTQYRQTFNGPMPHPKILAGYGKLVESAPERILKVFEADSQHARDFEMTALDAQRRDNKRVHWMAFSLISTGYGMSALFALMNKDWLAGIVLTTTNVGTVVGFLQGKSDAKSPERSEGHE
ncbi:DUF2335 domain-containing protein [Duganella sp. HH105]|uniref:DUF2335 domain-containing protein n=1 Tax=Duganella sp. HH105 TaxID=1781067 RepID=UPI000A04E373|nr:DUF2335 domain-containing protein [Duganella sp. HH105]